MARHKYVDELTQSVVSRILLDVGWHTGTTSALNVLSDLFTHYIRQLSITAVDYANHCGRPQPTIDDLAIAFDAFKIDLSQLQDYILNVDSSPLPRAVPFFPLPCRQNRTADNWEPNQDRPEYYNEFLPSLNLNILNKPNLEPSLNDKSMPIGDITEPKEEENGQTNGNGPINGIATQYQSEEPGETAASEDGSQNKNKLVLRLSLSKSIDEAAESNQTNGGDAQSIEQESNQTTSSAIMSSLKSSRAFQHFINSGLFKNPYDPLIKSSLRAADAQRLVNTHQSRSNSPEPETQSVGGALAGDNLNQSLLEEKKARRKSKKKNKTVDFTDSPFGFSFDESLTPNIKVKEIGSKKKKDSSEKKSKKKFMPFSIKMPGLSDEMNMDDSPFDLMPFDPNSEQTTKKRSYKKKGSAERRGGGGRKSKNSPLKTSFPGDMLGGVFDLEDGELPPSPTTFAQAMRSRSISPTKKGKVKSIDPENILTDNEAARMLLLMSESNQSSLDRKRKCSEMASDDDSMDGLNEPSLSKSKKASVRPPAKRPKGPASKKVAKSAELIESSGDSSDDDVNKDSNPVSLLPPPPEPSLLLDPDSNSTVRKRHNSSSSISSISSLNSSISSTSKAASIEQLHEKTEKHKSKFGDDVPKSEGKESKHKKNKKHSKDKNREEKVHKKHKKLKDKDKEPKEKQREKEKEKHFKPKLSIKLGPNLLDFKRSNDDFSSHRNESNDAPLDMSTSSLPTDSAGFPKFFTIKPASESNSTKKKRGRPSEKKKSFPEGPPSELVFIKDNKAASKEVKIKTPVINVASSIFDINNFALEKSTSKSSGKQKLKEPKLDSDVHRKEVKAEEKKEIKSKKDKDSPSFSLSIKTSGEEKLSKKEKLKDEVKVHSSKKPTAENKSCIVIRETIDVDESVDDKVWICPDCSLPDDGSPMIGCDDCDEWYHYKCAGILHEPGEDEQWFCPLCRGKKHKKSDKSKKKEKRTKLSQSSLGNSLTITAIPPFKANLAALGSEISLTPIGPSTTSGIRPLQQPAVTITPTSTPSTSGYKPTGRPRGRPRKDSKLQSQGSLTITPIPPASTSFDSYATQPSTADEMFNASAPKRSKLICPRCKIDNDSEEMIPCENCKQWHHWVCVGINSAPSPDSPWMCSKCLKKKSSSKYGHSSNVSLTDAKFFAATGGDRRGGSMKFKDDNAGVPGSGAGGGTGVNDQSCGVCHISSSLDEEVSDWIACDDCEMWYHFVCAGINYTPDDEESWFCNKCIARQKSIATKLAKIKRI